MNHMITTYQKKEEALFGGSSLFYRHKNQVRFFQNELPKDDITAKPKARDLKPAEAISHYNKTGDYAPLIKIFKKNNAKTLQKLYEHWDHHDHYIRKVKEPSLLHHIYQHLREQTLCNTISTFLGSCKLPGYKWALLELLLSQQNPLSEAQRTKIAKAYLPGIKGLQEAQINQIKALLLGENALPEAQHEWMISILTHAILPKPKVVIEIFEAYLEKYGTQWLPELESGYYRGKIDERKSLILLFLAKHGQVEHKALVRQALEEAIAYYSKGNPHFDCEPLILGYARIAGYEAMPYLKELLLEFDVLDLEVIKALALIAENTQDEALVQWILSLYGNKVTWGYHGRFEFTLAIQQIMGTNDLTETMHLYPTEKSKQRARKFLKYSNKTDKELIEVLRTMELIPEEVSNDKLLESISGEVFFSHDDKVQYFLEQAGVFFQYDLEGEVLPLQYTRLLEMFAAHSRGVFCPREVRQYQRKDRVLSVTFQMDAFKVKFHPDDQEDWYDCSTVAAAVNLSLIRQQSEAYFQEMNSGENTAMYIFTTPEKVQWLTQEFDFEHNGAPSDLKYLASLVEDE